MCDAYAGGIKYAYFVNSNLCKKLSAREIGIVYFRQFQYHIIQIKNLQMEIMPIHG